jgi:hypothetical protein
MKSTWYVAFELPKGVKQPGRRTLRETKTFENEAAAKEFARIKYAAGLKANAGTINPHVPKRVIAWTEIHRWLDEGREQEADDEALASGLPPKDA